MTKAESGAAKKTTTRKDESAFTFGVAVSLITTVPIMVGSASLIYAWPVIPFNFSLAVFIVTIIVATFRFYETRAEAREEERDKAWRKHVHKMRDEMRDEFHAEMQAAMRTFADEVLTELRAAAHDTRVAQLTEHLDQHLEHAGILRPVRDVRGR